MYGKYNPHCVMVVINFLSGQITVDESIFTYLSGQSASDFSNPSHMPSFLDEIRSSLEGNSDLVEICGNNTQCMFDIDQTGDTNVGMDTLQFEEQAVEQVVTLGITHIMWSV